MKNVIENEDGTITVDGKRFAEVKQEPTEYQMTDADWQRVVDEKFLCFVSSSAGCKDEACPVYLREVVNNTFYTLNCGWEYARVMRRVGHRQPHFGDKYLGHPNDSVIVKLEGGIWNDAPPFLAGDYDWGSGKSDSITEYIVLEEGIQGMESEQER